MKCAIIEYNPCHDLTFPTLVYLLQRLNVSVHIFTSDRNIARNVFAYTDFPKVKIYSCENRFYRWFERLGGYRFYDFVIINTIEPKNILQRVSEFPTPALTILHNAELYREDPDYTHYFQQQHHAFLVLAKHIVDHIAAPVPVYWVLHCYQGEVHFLPEKDQTVFCVQGNIDYTRRNYLSLIEAISILIADGVTNFKVLIIGGAVPFDREQFKDDIVQNNIEDYVEVIEGDIPYDNYFQLLGSADFLLFLLDTTSQAYQVYITEKLSSSLAICLGMNLIPIIHPEFADAYQIADTAITYNDGKLAEAMRLAITLQRDERERRKHQVEQRQQKLLQQSMHNLKMAIENVLGEVL